MKLLLAGLIALTAIAPAEADRWWPAPHPDLVDPPACISVDVYDDHGNELPGYPQVSCVWWVHVPMVTTE